MAVRDSGAVQRLPGPPASSAESVTSLIGPITLGAKHAGERSAGKPPAAFDVAGPGNVMMAAGLRATAKAVESPPEPKIDAPVLHPTDEGEQVRSPMTGLLRHRQAKGAGTDRFDLTRPFHESAKKPVGRRMNKGFAGFAPNSSVHRCFPLLVNYPG